MTLSIDSGFPNGSVIPPLGSYLVTLYSGHCRGCAILVARPYSQLWRRGYARRRYVVCLYFHSNHRFGRDYYLQPEVLFASNTLKYSVLFMIGFVFLSKFFEGKLRKYFRPLFHKSTMPYHLVWRELVCWPVGPREEYHGKRLWKYESRWPMTIGRIIKIW